jgi:hypothetical protein
LCSERQVGADPAEAEARYFMRRRFVFWFYVIGIAACLARIPPVVARWPAFASLSLWLVVPFLLLGLPLTLWAARCTICGAGLKLGGYTCSRCGHVFVGSKR